MDNLSERDIQFVKADVELIDTDSGMVKTSGGALEYDYLVVALGAHLAPHLVSGLQENGLNLYDPLQSEMIRDKLLQIKSGSVAIAITGMPYKCPPAPFEAALIIDSMLQRLGIRDRIKIDVYSPAPMTLPAAGPHVSNQVLGMLQSEGIEFHPSCKIKGVEPGRLIFHDGTADFDILLAVPPHVLPRVAEPLARGKPFIPIDRLGRTHVDNVFAVGDVTVLPTDKGAVPKAGVFAEGEGAAVASCIIHDIVAGSDPAPFDGKGGCFIESGRDTASIISVDAFKSKTDLSEATADNLDAKIQFERERLSDWLG